MRKEGIFINDESFNYLKPILRNWIEIFDSNMGSINQFENFWYNEQSFNTFLAAACWQKRIPVIAEAKAGKHNPSTNEKWSGRVDLLLNFLGKRIAIESKLLWIGERSKKKTVLNKLDTAIKEAKQIPSEFAHDRIGMLFAMFWVRPEVELSKLFEDKRSLFIKQSPTFVAWNVREIKMSSNEEEYSPGGFLVGQSV